VCGIIGAINFRNIKHYNIIYFIENCFNIYLKRKIYNWDIVLH
jgi:hypothetical protein